MFVLSTPEGLIGLDRECDGAIEVAEGTDINAIYIENGQIHQKPPQPSLVHSWDETTNTWTADIEQVRTLVLRKIEAERERRGYLPITYADTLFDADVQAQRNISVWQTQMANGTPLPAGFVWRDYFNVNRPCNAAFLNGLGSAIVLRGTLLYQAAWAHKAAISALQTSEELLAYSVIDNWIGI